MNRQAAVAQITVDRHVNGQDRLLQNRDVERKHRLLKTRHLYRL
jgi:hypothetical protein